MRRSILASGFVAVLLTAGCASLAPAKPEDAVRERATARWHALLAHEFKGAYEFNTPTYRAVRDYDKFRAIFGNGTAWTGAEVVGVTCETAVKCTARIRIDAKPLYGTRFGDTISTHVDEAWLKEGEQWWLVQPL
jgi:hypothetical protein